MSNKRIGSSERRKLRRQRERERQRWWPPFFGVNRSSAARLAGYWAGEGHATILEAIRRQLELAKERG